jgi:hypothetical protein
MMIVATIKRSAGNETIGDMWQETAIFASEQSIEDVFKWAQSRYTRCYSIPTFENQETHNVILSIGQ